MQIRYWNIHKKWYCGENKYLERESDGGEQFAFDFIINTNEKLVQETVWAWKDHKMGFEWVFASTQPYRTKLFKGAEQALAR